jgi:hypothetical protein
MTLLSTIVQNGATKKAETNAQKLSLIKQRDKFDYHILVFSVI